MHYDEHGLLRRCVHGCFSQFVRVFSDRFEMFVKIKRRIGIYKCYFIELGAVIRRQIQTIYVADYSTAAEGIEKFVLKCLPQPFVTGFFALRKVDSVSLSLTAAMNFSFLSEKLFIRSRDSSGDTFSGVSF